MINLEQIKKILPHRDPFLFIDEITNIDHENLTISGKKTFTPDMPIFQGHFPDFPITPGVVILEAMAQTGAYLVLSKDEYKGKIAYFIGADNVKWRNPVLPGDTAIFTIEVTKFRAGIGVAEAKAFVNDQLACEATIKVAVK